MPGSSDDSDVTQPLNSTTVQQLTLTNSNAKFPYLVKEEYELWSMKMQSWIAKFDYHLWKIVLKGNSPKKTTRDPDGNIILNEP